MDIVSALFLTLGALASLYAVRWGAALYRSQSLALGASQRVAAPGLILIVIGFVTNFFDTLGIGSFATTTTTSQTPGTRARRTDSWDDAGRSYAAGGRAGVCVHQHSVGGSHAARLSHRGHDGWRVAGRGRRVAAAAAGHPGRNGHGALARRVLHGNGAAAALSDRRTGAGARTGPFRCRVGWQLRAGCARNAGNRQLWAKPGPLQPARDGPPRRVSNHDGIRGIHGCRGGNALHKKRVLRCACGDRADRQAAFPEC